MSLKSMLEDKINNIPAFVSGIDSVLDVSLDNNLYFMLLGFCTTIVEIGMVTAFKLTGGCNTNYICRLYDDDVLDAKYQVVTERIRSVRNNLVHHNIYDLDDLCCKFVETIEYEIGTDGLSDYVYDLCQNVVAISNDTLGKFKIIYDKVYDIITTPEEASMLDDGDELKVEDMPNIELW